MDSPLIIALPSKGRLKEQVEAWLADCALKLEADGGARGYSGRLKGLQGAQVRLLSAGDIAEALDTGEVHLGVTGEDLMRERPGDLSGPVAAAPGLWPRRPGGGDAQELAGCGYHG